MNELEIYLSLPWTLEPTERDDDGHYHVLRIAELPGFVVADANAATLDVLFWEALAAFLRSYLERGEEPPTPAGCDAYVARCRRGYMMPEVLRWGAQAAQLEQPGGVSAGSLASTRFEPAAA